MKRFLSVCVLLGSLSLTAQAQVPAKPVLAKQGMVVCVSPDAADIGVAILKKGGTAVDASVAVALAMAVTHPAAGNIGGGGFMLVHPPRGTPTLIEYRETAPASVKPDTFKQTTSWLNHQAVGVPGTIRGLELAHRKFGKLPWRDLVLPAVKLAEEGFVLEAVTAKSLNDYVKKAGTSEEFIRIFGKAGGKENWQAGNRLVQKDLARTLKRIAEQGPDAFYTGELAELLEREMLAGGGFVTREDLKNYRAVERVPVRGSYRGYDVYSAAPPSGGGTVLVEMLHTLENFDLKKSGPEEVETRHLLAETMRRGYADRARYIGDPAFVRIPNFLTEKSYAAKVAEGIDLTKATPSENLKGEIELTRESDSTTHFSVIDRDGLAVSNTYTLEESYGSRVVVRGAGYILNNEMGDFNSRPGVTTTKGRIGTEPNQVAPGKRMLSSQTPTILAKNGLPYLITGSPGGRTITNTVLCVIVNVVDFGMDVQAAVDAPRQHHQWFPDELRLETKDPKLIEGLKALGHKVTSQRQGDAHSILVDPKTGQYHGAADRRLIGKAAGY